jgi:spore germination protein GerM
VIGGKERLVAVEAPVPAHSPARGALETLLSAPPSGYLAPLPSGVTLHSVKVAGGVATADFSRELVSGFRGGSDNEGIAVYSIVNTLCSLPGVERAQILVDGHRVDSLGGHLDTSGPLAANRELVVTRDG